MTCFRCSGFLAAAIVLLLVFPGNARLLAQQERPNIVWIVVEDMSLPFGCYGEKDIQTPNVDALARAGLRFDRAFVTAPVCSTCRSAMITGMYQTSIGAHHHRSGRGQQKIVLPEGVKPVPLLFQQAGYFTANGSFTGMLDKVAPREAPRKAGKTDYNFQYDKSIYDSHHFSHRQEGQPFFAQYQLRGGKGRNIPTPRPIAAADVTLPVYYPDDALIRQDWAFYLNSVMNTDLEVGRILRQLEDAGELERTFVFFLTDHGVSHVRGKQFMYEEGMRIPLIMRGPGIEAGQVRPDLVLQIDLAATSLALAGIGIPTSMQGIDLLADNYQPRKYIVSARDRCDETVDRMRAVRTENFKYIRNFYPQRPYLQPNAYKDNKPIIRQMRALHAAGVLDRNQARIMAEVRPAEELYDLRSDPNELDNLAGSRKGRRVLAEHQAMLNDWIVQSGDQGATPETDAMYDSDMKIYLDTMKTRRPERFEEIQGNVNLMKRWASEGK
jgi:arylsulfatase A-like enzyme